MPRTYYLDWLKVAAEEAQHFSLLRAQLQAMGYDYGDFPAHTGLWDMTRKTEGDLLARCAWRGDCSSRRKRASCNKPTTRL